MNAICCFCNGIPNFAARRMMYDGGYRIAVKLRGVDQRVVTSDQLGPGDTFGESCMLEELRAQRSKAHERGDLGDTMTVFSVVDGEAFEAGRELPERHDSLRKTEETAGKSMETYQTMKVREVIQITSSLRRQP